MWANELSRESIKNTNTKKEHQHEAQIATSIQSYSNEKFSYTWIKIWVWLKINHIFYSFARSVIYDEEKSITTFVCYLRADNNNNTITLIMITMIAATETATIPPAIIILPWMETTSHGWSCLYSACFIIDTLIRISRGIGYLCILWSLGFKLINWTESIRNLCPICKKQKHNTIDSILALGNWTQSEAVEQDNWWRTQNAHFSLSLFLFPMLFRSSNVYGCVLFPNHEILVMNCHFDKRVCIETQQLGILIRVQWFIILNREYVKWFSFVLIMSLLHQSKCIRLWALI